MPAPPTESLRVVKYAPGWGYAAVEWERALGAVDWRKPHAQGGPERLKIRRMEDGTKDATVWRATVVLGGRPREVVLKVERLGTVKKRVQALVRRTKAFRQWRGAERLAKVRSLRVGQPAAVLRSPVAETLVLEHLAGPTLLELAAGQPLPIPTETRIARAFAWEMGRLVMGGLSWPDMKASNLLVIEPDSERPSIGVIDTLGVGRLHPVHPFFPMVAELAGTGHLPRRALLMRFTHHFVREYANWELSTPKEGHAAHIRWTRAERRSLWHTIKEGLAVHGDPTPKDDPLARE